MLVYHNNSSLSFSFCLFFYSSNFFKGIFTPLKIKFFESNLSILKDYAFIDIYDNTLANGPRDNTFDESWFLSALFKVYGRNVSIEYMNNIDFVITELGLFSSFILISSLFLW